MTSNAKAARHQIERIQKQLHRIDEELLPEKKPHVEPSATHHDSGTEHAGSEQTRDRAGAGDLPRGGAQSPALQLHRTCRRLHRAEKAEPYRQQILELFDQCKGNLVRVHEELVAGGAELSYPALTAFCRRHGIGNAPPVPAGQYHFAPGEEMQHDTSPHELELGGRKRKVQTASAVLCYSRMLFFQCYPTFRRFDCKVFLTEALRYMGGATDARHDR